jgi:hypothetical protein
MRKMMFTNLFLLGTLTAFAATTVTPAVNKGTINYGNYQVTLTGSGFEPATAAPTVTFNGASLKIDSFTNTQVVATLPANTPAGTFTVTVKNSEGQSGSFDLTYGATGPQGAQGLDGPKGATGATGPQGPKGNTGKPGGVLSYATRVQGADITLPYYSLAHLYTITLPNTGSYILNGQVHFQNQNFNGPISVQCYLADSSETVSEGLPPSTATILPDFDGTLPLNGIYVVQSAPKILTLLCSYGPVLDYTSDLVAPVNATDGVLTAIQVQ